MLAYDNVQLVVLEPYVTTVEWHFLQTVNLCQFLLGTIPK